VLRPVNRHILVNYSPPQESADSGILLPDDYKPPTEDYVVVDVLAVSEDVSIRCNTDDQIVIDKKMLQEISVNHSIYYLILENYVIGVIE
jgi:co-chaperonin GroES (HSP10)